jgi:tetratricopeptide (TPR) repeat protein
VRTRLTLPLASISTAVTSVLVISAQTPAGQQVFRTSTDVITVDVSVRNGDSPADGLTASDFVVLDNGVRQTVESIDIEAVPVDVSILVDINQDVADDAEDLSNEVRKIAAMVRPADRIRVTAINTYVHDLVATAPGRELPALGRLAATGLSSAHDGLAAALLRQVDPNRRHLIIALTNGIDAVSTLDAAAVRDIARRSEALLHIAQVDMALDESQPPQWISGRQRLDRFRCREAAICSPTRYFWEPFTDREFDTLAEAAAITGGALHHPGVFTDRSASAVFRKVFGEFRRSYLLRYTPQGVVRQGWHEISVTLPRLPSYKVQARRGYTMDPATPAPHTFATHPVRPGWRSGSFVGSLVTAFDEKDLGAYMVQLRQLHDAGSVIRDLRAAGNPWPATPRREAAFVLTLADQGLHSRTPLDREESRNLLLTHANLVRHPIEPDAFERYWLWAAILVVEGANQPEMARPFVDYALTRFPSEPRFVLARAFIADQRRPLSVLRPRGTATSLPAALKTHAEEVTARYDAAMKFSETAAEARVRKAWFLHRMGQDEEALSILTAPAATAPPDALIDYLRHLFRAQVLDALGRTEDAVAAFRSALVVAPSAQSPKVGLMSLFVRQSDHRAAAELANIIQTAPTSVWDPWWGYWQGDYRLFGEAITRLREQTK